MFECPGSFSTTWLNDKWVQTPLITARARPMRARDQCARGRPTRARATSAPSTPPHRGRGPPAHLVHELGRVSWPGLNFSLRLVSRQVVCQSAGALWVDRERPRVSRAQWAVVQMLALQDTERVAQIGHFELHATSEICASTHCVASYLVREIGLAAGLQDCRTAGLQDCRTAGMQGFRAVGLQDF